ncbi:MAG: hypothetical protein SX243_04675 [Acidobacteriota bacterium]|nr:hypothetical protein [Acidobacteriota bacterium]
MSTASLRHLLLTLAVAALTLAGINHWAELWTDPGDGPEGPPERSAAVRELPREPASLPPAPRAPTVLLMGNSHTYTLPGLERGEPLRPDPGATLIDELHRRLPEAGDEAVFLRLSYPNFLPFEMLLRYGQLSLEGYRPRVVVLGLTWRNLARDRQPRHQIRRVLEDPERAHQLARRLHQAPIEAPEPVLAMLDEQRRRQAYEEQQDRQRSAADRMDARLTEILGEEVALIGRSPDLRARLYRELAYGIEHWLVPQEESAFSYPVIDADLELNLACLRTLLRWLDADGARVLLYRAPQRSDLPPLVDPRRLDQELSRIEDFAHSLGFVTVDATAVVPNEFWGWDRSTPDRSHFTEPGHSRLAQTLVDEGRTSGLWQALTEDPDRALQ